MQNSQNAKKHLPIKWIFIGAVLILFGAAVLIYPKAKQQYTAPLGPSLDLPTHTPAITAPSDTQTTQSPVISPASTQTETQTIALNSTITPFSSPTAAATSTPKPLCGGPPVMMVLGVGADNGENNYSYGLGDVIRIARIDFVTPKVSILTLPRDLWVEIPDIKEHYGITHGKLNQSYFYGGKGMNYYDGPGEGPGLMARTLDLNFGLRVDHYGAVNFWSFPKIIDAVGGIDVYLPRAVDGTTTDPTIANMGYFTAGRHHFNGDQALRFSRIRHNIGDFARQDNQNTVLCALKAKVLSPAVLPKVPQIIAALKDSVLTDLSLEQMTQLACLLPEMNRENILFTSLPKDLFTQGSIYSPQMRSNTFVLQADFNLIRDYVNKFIAGVWPTESTESTCRDNTSTP